MYGYINSETKLFVIGDKKKKKKLLQNQIFIKGKNPIKNKSKNQIKKPKKKY